MNKLHASKLVEYGLSALVALGFVLSSTGCTATEIQTGVNAAGSFFTNSEGSIVGFGTFPDGRTVVGVLRVLPNGAVLFGKYSTTVNDTVAIARDLGMRSYWPIAFTSLHPAVQLRILASVTEMVEMRSVMAPLPVFLPMFLTAPIITAPGNPGCVFNGSGWVCEKIQL